MIRFLIPLLISSMAWSLDRVQVVVNAPASTPDNATLYLTGNIDQLCQWKPDCMAMSKIGIGVYQVYVPITPGQNVLQFKVTRGSWATEAVDKNSQTLPNYVINLSLLDSPILVNVVNWRDNQPLGVTGRLDHLSQLFSPELGNSRDISIWLPPDYDSKPNKKFPVIYMHDGQNLFDPSTSLLGIDWGIDETLTRLIQSKTVPSAIVVGINNTSDRNGEYDYSLRGKTYARFIIQTLKPYIDQHYRSLADRDHTFTMGSSMGALISLSLLWTHPEVFSRAAGLSLPAFADNNMIIDMVNSEPAPKLPIKFYFDHGDQGQDASYDRPDNDLRAAILKVGIPAANIDLDTFPYANHSELDWSRRAFIPLAFLLN